MSIPKSVEGEGWGGPAGALLRCPRRASALGRGRCPRTTRPGNTDTKAGDKPDDVTDPSHFMRTFDGNWGKGDKPMAASRPFDFAKYKRPHEGPMQKLPHFRPAETSDGEMPTENLSSLLARVSENSTSQIDDLVGDFGRLREKLQTDRERIQREIEEYSRLSQQVMQLTRTISEGVEKVRASADRPQGGSQETE
jgi:hypothetical protein